MHISRVNYFYAHRFELNDGCYTKDSIRMGKVNRFSNDPRYVLFTWDVNAPAIVRIPYDFEDMRQFINLYPASILLYTRSAIRWGVACINMENDTFLGGIKKEREPVMFIRDREEFYAHV